MDASSSAAFTPFTSKATGLAGTGTTNSNTYAMLAASGTEYGRVNRTALATYDTNGFTAATVAQTTSTSYLASGIPNTNPTITSISNQSTTQNTATSAIAFTIGDAETAAASLTLSGTSSNTTLVPNASITFGGSAENRTVTVTPATNQAGTATITVTVSDGGLTASSAFTLTVTSTAPTISNIAISPATPTSADTVAVSATKTASWLTLSPASGTLASGANVTVTASINTNANSLSSGTFADTITFTNTTNGTGNTTRGASLSVNFTTAPNVPVMTALSAFSQGKTKTVSWAAAAGATSYTVEIASTANFATVLTSQTVTGTSATFSNLASGTLYYYRVLATNNIGSSAYSNVVSSTQDNVSPAVAITSPASATSTATATLTVNGTASDSLSGISAVTVNGVSATSANNFATWSVSIPLGFGTNGVTAVAFDGAGNVTTTSPVNVTLTTAQTNNPLIIPEVMTGTTFDLNLHPTTKQFYTGAATSTYAYNNMLFWGPTLIMNKGDWVQLNVTNNLTADSTTTHWHGFHIPAIMDGGPHQTIVPGTTWKPSFKVDNNAGLYWYHPHLHEKTQEHLAYGAGGLIIIRDEIESALNLPRTYGVDDIPLALTSRRFTANQIVATGAEYGDVMLTNGVLNAQVTLPRQYVRLRILNSEAERSYNLGFSDNRTFYQICTDGGLVNAPIALTRLVLAVGERCEILVDLSADTQGSTFNLQAYNSGQANDFPGGEPATTGRFGSLLNNTTFTILKINVGAQTANPVLTRPATLTTNTFYTAGQVTNTRNVTLTNGFPGTGLPFSFNNLVYSPSVINQTINLNAIEQWNLTNTSGFSHAFHIHDIQFKIVSRTGGNNAGVKAYEDGWKDVLFIGQNQTVSFITKFDHFASNTNPFMYHCHFGSHEDEGMMGQFVVVNNATEDLSVASFTRYGNNSLIQLDFKATPGTTYTLEWSPDLSNWQDVTTVTSDGNSATFTETDETRLTGNRGFYRVKIPTIP